MAKGVGGGGRAGSNGSKLIKKTKMLIIEGTKVQYFAVDIGEKIRDVRSKIPEPIITRNHQYGLTLIFTADEEPDYVKDKSKRYFGGRKLKAVIEYQPEI